MRLIESNKVIPLVRLILMNHPKADAICENVQKLVDIHTIEAEPVKHGYWTIDTREYRYGPEDDIDEEFFLKCSECGREVWLSDWTAIQNDKYEEILKEYPYCHCGAKMQGGESD